MKSKHPIPMTIHLPPAFIYRGLGYKDYCLIYFYWINSKTLELACQAIAA